MRRFGPALSVVVLLSAVIPQSFAQCGVERWSVKTGTDPQAPSVNLGTYTSTTIYNFQQSVRPASLPSNGRVSPRETTQYSVNGTLTKYKRETDSDYHLVIQDGAGRTMIVELPNINCVGSGSPFRSGISNARAQFDAKLTATSSFKTVSAPVTIRGVGFWDFLHGQTGVAPNGIEVHPVLNVAFTGPITMNDPGTIAVKETREPVALPADMVEDDDGGRVRVFRSGGEALGELLFHGGPVIENPRIRVLFAGDWSAEAQKGAIETARSIALDRRLVDLERYGVRSAGIALTGAGSVAADALSNDLDVQRVLARAVESGSIQHVDEDVITIVLVPETAQLAVGTTTDWTSYHSLFHPTELGMPYVVVRDGRNLREAMFSSLARAILSPRGDGWF